MTRPPRDRERLRVVRPSDATGIDTPDDPPPPRAPHRIKHFAPAPAGWTAWLRTTDASVEPLAIAGFATVDGGAEGDFVVPLALGMMRSGQLSDPRDEPDFLCLTPPSPQRQAQANALGCLADLVRWRAWRRQNGHGDYCSCWSYNGPLCAARRGSMRPAAAAEYCDCDCHCMAMGRPDACDGTRR